MNKKIIIIVCFLLIVAMCFSVKRNYFVNTKNNIDKNEYDNKKYENMLSMMLETSAGTGEYQEALASSWPTEGYAFNENLSKCENGSSLSWDNINKKVIMEGNSADKCYVYFDVKPIETLADHIKSLYTTQGANNLYLHDSTLENGAGDNSYRFAGPSETTNNFVCFGYDSKDGSCPTDNLYRIIGVFNGEVKLIKYDYAKSTLLGTDGDYVMTYQVAGYGGTNKGQNSKAEIGTYYWNYFNGGASTNDWSESRLNTVNLNKNYLYNMGEKWSKKISDHTWKVGGNTANNIASQTAPNAYENEINNPATNKTVNAKVGLMYVSDYGYAASSSSWSTALYSYSTVIANNWMHMGLIEWTLEPQTASSDYAFKVSDIGNIYQGNVRTGLQNSYDEYSPGATRPVFYLKSVIGYSVGSGTISSPYILE